MAGPVSAASGSLRVNEFMAKNNTSVVDEDGAHSDWIEVFNAGAEQVNLEGWYLTDDATRLGKWQFPAVSVEPGGFLLIWASDKNRRVPGAPLHTNFKLADEGEYLALVEADGRTVAGDFSPKFPPQFPDVSYGVVAGGSAVHYLARATPGSINSGATNFVVSRMRVSPGSGWYDRPVSVTLTSATPGVTIYYTTNGSEPSATNGLVYARPVEVVSTVVLRAIAVRAGFAPAPPVAQTYLFLDQVLQQTGAGWPTNWGESPARYAMDPAIVGDPNWGASLRSDFRAIPTVSLAMDREHLFGTNGIYSNPIEEGEAWERPCSFQYFQPDCSIGVQINCGVRIQGELSRDPLATSKHNFRLLFKQEYGAGRLGFDLYPGSPVREFDGLVLHGSFNDHWVWSGAHAQMLRDQWCADTQTELGGRGPHGSYVHLYLNGLYWGVYNLGERPDASYAAHYFGGERSSYDAFNGGELVDGDDESWIQMYAIAYAGITNEVAYTNLARYVDLPAFADYLLLNFYAGNEDWPYHNWRAAGDVRNGVPFRFFSWDAELTLSHEGGPVTVNRTDVTEGRPGFLYTALRQSAEFRLLMADRARSHFFGNGVLTPARCVERWLRRAREIEQAMVAESARWGRQGSQTFTRDDWAAEQQRLMTQWFPHRTAVVLEQLREAGLYPTLEAPTVAPDGGLVSEVPLLVTLSAPSGTVYYTTNGADPRLAWAEVSPEAFRYEGPLTVMESATIRARARQGDTWSALVEATFLRPTSTSMPTAAVRARCDGSIELTFVGVRGAAYTLMAADDLEHWSVVTNLVAGLDGSFTYQESSTTAGRRFYRLRWP